MERGNIETRNFGIGVQQLYLAQHRICSIFFTITPPYPPVIKQKMMWWLQAFAICVLDHWRVGDWGKKEGLPLCACSKNEVKSGISVYIQRKKFSRQPCEEKLRGYSGNQRVKADSQRV